MLLQKNSGQKDAIAQLDFWLVARSQAHLTDIIYVCCSLSLVPMIETLPSSISERVTVLVCRTTSHRESC